MLSSSDASSHCTKPNLLLPAPRLTRSLDPPLLWLIDIRADTPLRPFLRSHLLQCLNQLNLIKLSQWPTTTMGTMIPPSPLSPPAYPSRLPLRQLDDFVRHERLISTSAVDYLRENLRSFTSMSKPIYSPFLMVSGITPARRIQRAIEDQVEPVA